MSLFLKSLNIFLITGLKIFLANAINAPSVTAKIMANGPYKIGASLEN